MTEASEQAGRGYILVTGGSRGIGAAICEQAARDGYDVCINYRSDEKQALSVAQTVRGHGRKALTVQADIADAGQIADMFHAADRQLGRLAALVNNAGTSGFIGRVDAISATDLQAIFALNVVGSFLCCGEAVRRMSTSHGGKGGGIVNISSAAARLGAAGRNVHYAASKRALEALTFGLAQEVAGEGIQVNTVSPGVIDTDIHPRERLAQLGPQLPMKRPGTVGEVAAAVMWLLSPAASYVSGTNLGVSGAR
ncbi:SDR family oxidoreductase [Bordetella bronchiseptica]|uniref:SDR family oxidoreductase n=1 Tax=Bordetella bronchiseptica TaxID=518 RepID=UPI000459B244|nr:SDR family oxidoreductase [Bordetella bronchiseptica]KDD50088.1 KR domain protein [Bordetella bronchiseptica OSU553]AUL16996.1 NAD(P)-dependent oxidoreductase [Bordetella bronchiseptica]AWP60224.1 NAD(P)-dependent oxidoreductase [Bordetella bronchiseptica]AWQ07065.1 NAD(P)-dependent oxidoreductase [Bordetella bronchiseptica]KAK52740.1 KR domain protein [Bordetella bronchiseptica OSU054]